jgi:UTP--glucose-1-phosphate uridylyltransferase
MRRASIPMTKPVRKAVIPAAGFGTRFLPVAKAVPKEMLPIVDKPVIQYVVEEAAASGITDIIIVISRTKRAIEDLFAPNEALEAELESKGKTEALDELRRLRALPRIRYVLQPRMGGLGDAVLCAREAVGDEPFAVLLGDALVSADEGAKPVTRQLMDAHEKHGGSVVALEEVPLEKVGRYGIVGGTAIEGAVIRADRIVEKPKPEEAPSRLAVSARYVFSPAIFEELARTPAGKGGELQLTDAMTSLMAREPLFGVRYAGRRHDIGNKLDFVKANIWWGLRRAEMRDELRRYLRELIS